jgi:hypothetical protein
VVSVDRAQAHTLEAFVAALILLAGIIFATQATAVTPLSASTSNQHIENQQRAVATDLLSIAAEDGSLRESVVYWNHTPGNESFAEVTSDERTYYSQTPPLDHPLRELLEKSFTQTQIAYNVDVIYLTDANPENASIQEMVHMGTPSDNAVTVSRTVVLFENTTFSYPSGTTDRLVDNESEFYAPNVGSGAVYNVVEVRLTVWRM